MAAAVTSLALAFAGCTSSATETVPAQPEVAGTEQPTPTVSTAVITANVMQKAKQVRVDKQLVVEAQGGTLSDVAVKVGKGRTELDGRMSPDETRWIATQRLEPGRRYRIQAAAVDEHGLAEQLSRVFRTDDLTLDEQTFPSIAPLQGETVGVGMPVIVRFDVPVTDRASIERHLSVESTPKQVGSWHWLNDHEVHWRPKGYWEPGTEVTVHADINSVSAGNGIYGQKSRTVSFEIGDAIISHVDVDAHTMEVRRNGELLQTIPITAGKDGFTTRSGIKVIMEKHRYKTMDAATIGIAPGDPEYYAIDTEYAMRVTYSGEFIHGAPWSTGSQGAANVSHGCVGMSLEDAAWLFSVSHRGDVVRVTGTERTIEPGNGYTEWNQSFREYREGSAVH